jgi:hypothetical protein
MIPTPPDDAVTAAVIAIWTKIQDARQVAEGFLDAWTGKDFERARGLLHDDVPFAPLFGAEHGG